MSAQEYVQLELSHPYAPNKEDILNILGAWRVYEIIEDGLEISEVTIPNVYYLLSTFLEQEQKQCLQT